MIREELTVGFCGSNTNPPFSKTKNCRIEMYVFETSNFTDLERNQAELHYMAPNKPDGRNVLGTIRLHFKPHWEKTRKEGKKTR